MRTIVLESKLCRWGISIDSEPPQPLLTIGHILSNNSLITSCLYYLLLHLRQRICSHIHFLSNTLIWHVSTSITIQFPKRKHILVSTYLEVWRASWQDHLVGFTGLAITSQCHIGKRLFIPQVLEGWDHIGLEIIPTETKLLLVTLGHCFCEIDAWLLKIKTNSDFTTKSLKISNILDLIEQI